MMSNPFSVLRLRQQRVRLLLQQLIKREHLNEQQAQEGVRERQRAVMQGRYGDYAFRTLGRPPPAPPPRQSLLPGQANEQAPPGGERSTLDFQADFERAEESGKTVRGELRGEEDADSRSVRERGGEERVARGRDALEDAPREEDFFLQPIGQPTQGDAQGGQSGTGGDSGRNPSGQGGRGGGERGPGQHGAVPERLQPLQQILGRFETGIADPNPQVRADTLVAALTEIVWAKHGIGHPVQAMLLARIARYLNGQQQGEALLNTVGKVREALLQVGLQGAGMPSDRFALLPLQLLNCSRPRTGEQRRLAVERLDGGSAWLASHPGPRA